MEGFHTLFGVLLVQLLYGSASCLRITSIGVPRTVLSGDKVHLTCSFDLLEDDLYSLTWWKDDKMFFNYVPRNLKAKSVYETPGITVDETLSTLHEVLLSRVDHRASGKLRCEILSETFEQDTMEANMTVIDIPARGPTILGRRGNYEVGDLLLLNCSCPPSYPPATLTWNINGQKASRETVIIYPGDTDTVGRESSWSGLQMWLTTQHFQHGGLLLRCTASILHFYSMSTEVLITGPRNVESSPREGASTGGSSSRSVQSVETIVLGVTIILSILGT
ncbi:uncharacterized protein LOC135200971 [Macrobrachium nipponense]|uniref:uncharacterized protein LOC135200971 n=1 Tax=Macrobrachium nipponense TaxID=159736 RepID=UPI0030C8218A